MRVLKFSYFGSDDTSESHYFDGHCWSRPYEYVKVEKLLEKYLKRGDKVHNSSWGFAGVHIKFKEHLESLPFEVLHTDIKKSPLPNTDIYNIVEKPREEWLEAFDAVVNISTVEEVNSDHISILRNLLSMVKPGGYLMITFDLPGLQLEKVEEFLGCKIQDVSSRLSGSTSKYVNKRYSLLNCGYLVLQK
jgi:SAM-dependent methyltransferase